LISASVGGSCVTRVAAMLCGFDRFRNELLVE
jgi:hypothetical protein